MADIGDFVIEVRTGDHDRFLAIQLAPPAKRAGLYVLTAFHLELARIAETVNEPLIGQIRLTWWREGLEAIVSGQKPRAHPVMEALALLHAEAPSLFKPLFEMIEAREADLDESLLSTEEGWRNYLNGTAGALHYAWALWLDEVAAKTHQQRLSEDAQNYAKIGLIRAIPYMAQQGFMRFPQFLVAAHDVHDLTPSPALMRFVCAQLEKLEWRKDPLTLSLSPLSGLARLAQLHQKTIIKTGGDAFRVIPARLSAVWRIYQIKYF